MAMEKRWLIHRPNPERVHRIHRALNCSHMIAAILVNRGITSEEDAYQFLHPSLSGIRPPFSMKDLDVAAHRIHDAIVGKEPILIFGDYDVDGVTATTVMLEFLTYAGATVSYYIPHRATEGYGLQPDHIASLAVPKNIRLIITVDCGISSHEAVLEARKHHIDIIITDHHGVPDERPQALAVINPSRPDCPAGLDHLAGVGVAFYLLIYLRKHLRENGFWAKRTEPNLADLCDLVALGTIADMVPLVHENRIFSRIGIERIALRRRPGLTALMAVCGMDQVPEAEDIAFRLAPRINAAGRLAHAKDAVELLTTRDDSKAKTLSDHLNQLNTRRQDMERDTIESIHMIIEKSPQLREGNCIVLSHSKWHEGILGIMASRIVNAYFRPVVLISVRNGLGKGSARSIPGIHLYDMLKRCDCHLEAFGGHSAAAGLSLKAENIDPFQKALAAAISKTSTSDHFVPRVNIDGELDFADFSPELMKGIESLKPFGTANPEPLFMARHISVVSSKIVGKHHRKMLLVQTGSQSNTPVSAIHFNIDRHLPITDVFDRMAFRLRWNRWNGKKAIQMIVEEI